MLPLKKDGRQAETAFLLILSPSPRPLHNRIKPPILSYRRRPVSSIIKHFLDSGFHRNDGKSGVQSSSPSFQFPVSVLPSSESHQIGIVSPDSQSLMLLRNDKLRSLFTKASNNHNKESLTPYSPPYSLKIAGRDLHNIIGQEFDFV